MEHGVDSTSADTKAKLRKKLRARRNAHVAGLDPRVRSLMFMRPPSPVMALIPQNAVIGVYLAGAGEAPATAYARHFHEAGHRVALPWFADRSAAMTFREWTTPWVDETLVPGPWQGIAQPGADAGELVPDVLFVPLVGFDEDGGRLGQGGGHYDRWLAANPHAIPIGMAWDCQLATDLPVEAHDRPLRAVVTPTRFYGPFEDSQEHAA
ncbi:5-formyltetrahydrofolate cyclo-ligase [Novosphingobium sp. SL115]|uniref:5-formyltetrahydrofolate cyclo-ligase n=1 Tax=Novosphingobium sp. SL115 TaxID=2995150 RepID=UPI003FA3D858